MSKYYHGVRVIEEGEAAARTITGTAGMQVIVGTAPVNLTDNPEAAVNVPILCNSMEEAVKKLGYSTDFESYTLCQSMYASFTMFGFAPVVFINVLDPAKHKKDHAEKEYGIVNNQIRVDDVTGVLKSSVVVKNAETVLEVEKDYILSFDENGYLLITLISDVANGVQSLKVTTTSLDPSAVTEADIIGGYDAESGKESGMEVIRQVYPRTGTPAALISAPGWSHKAEVAAVMITKCEAINGVFTAECLLDLDTEKAKKYADVPKYKEESGYQDRHAIVLWPMVQVNKAKLYYSAVYGAMVAYTDATNDDVPNLYPSNHLLNADGAVLADGTEIYMDREQANTLNGAGVVTMINEGGWRAWGNNTSAYPDITDTKDRWIACRRMFTWMGNSLISLYHEKVDSPANYRLIEAICDSENIRLNSYVAAGKLAGARIEYNDTENTVENILNGQVIFRIYMAAFTPAEDIVFILKFDPELLTAALSGGEA